MSVRFVLVVCAISGVSRSSLRISLLVPAVGWWQGISLLFVGTLVTIRQSITATLQRGNDGTKKDSRGEPCQLQDRTIPGCNPVPDGLFEAGAGQRQDSRAASLIAQQNDLRVCRMSQLTVRRISIACDAALQLTRRIAHVKGVLLHRPSITLWAQQQWERDLFEVSGTCRL